MSGLEFPERPEGAPERAPGSDRPWSAWWAVPIAIGAIVAATVALLITSAIHDQLVDAPMHQPGNVGVALHGAPPVISFVATVVQDLALIAGAILAAAASLKGRLTAAHFGLRPARPVSSVAFVIAGYVTFILISALWLTATGIKDRENIPIQLGTRDSAAALVLAAILTCVVAPICEELFFRGFLFGALRRHGLIPAALVSGVAFGLAHVASAPIGFLVPLGTLGVILALLYEKTGSLYPSIGLHALNNSIAFGVGDGRSWLIPICLAGAAVAVRALAAAAAGQRRWRTVVPTP